jgi:ketosteroid isomerase-like protein
MKKHLFFLVLLLCIIVSACKTKCPPLTDKQKADIEKQILDVWAKYSTSTEKIDLNGVFSCYSSDEFLSAGSQGLVYNSRATYMDTVRVRFDKRKSGEKRQAIVKITVFTEDLALLTESNVFQINYKNDSMTRINDAISAIFKKEASGWKIIHKNESTKVIQ